MNAPKDKPAEDKPSKLRYIKPGFLLLLTLAAVLLPLFTFLAPVKMFNTQLTMLTVSPLSGSDGPFAFIGPLGNLLSIFHAYFAYSFVRFMLSRNARSECELHHYISEIQLRYTCCFDAHMLCSHIVYRCIASPSQFVCAVCGSPRLFSTRNGTFRHLRHYLRDSSRVPGNT